MSVNIKLFFSDNKPLSLYIFLSSLVISTESPKFSDCFSKILLLTKFSNTDVSSPIEINLVPEVIIFSTRVDPHLGTPIMKIGFIICGVNFYY